MWLNITIGDFSLLCVFLICCAIIIASLIRLYTKTTHVKFKTIVNLTGKTILITGANSGIGKETARYMAKNGARVIMACRNLESGKAVRDEIAAMNENSKVILHKVDLSSMESVRDFCRTISETEARIDVLIHNAGFGGVCKKSVSVDGIEYTMATNHYGPFLMTHLLMDLLKKSTPCRIVVLSSKSHTVSFLDPTVESHLNPVDYWFPLRLYANSKLANLLFTFELARRLKGTGITVNALHPGVIDSEIWRNYPFPLNIWMKISRIFMRTLEEGIQTTLHVALSPSLHDITGQYFRNCKLGKSSHDSLREDWQKLLWEKSKAIVGMKESDPKI